MGVVAVAGEQGASCRDGTHSEQALVTPVQDHHLQNWAKEEVGSWVEVQGSPVGLGAWGKVGVLGMG